MSAAVSTNDWLTASTPLLSANSRQARSWSVNALMPRSMPGRLRPFLERSSPPTATLQWTFVACHALDDQLHQSVVQEQPVARLHDLGQSRKAHRDPLGVADDVLAGQREGVAGEQLDRFRLDLADAHLGAGQVGHYGDALAGGSLRGADPRDAFGMTREVAVREVEPRNVQPRSNEAFALAFNSNGNLFSRTTVQARFTSLRRVAFDPLSPPD